MIGELLRAAIRAPGRRLRSLAHRWRSSLQLRVVTSALVVGVALVALIGVLVSTTVRDGLFAQRITAIDAEATRSRTVVQGVLSSSPVASSAEVQDLLNRLSNPQANGAPSALGTMLAASGEIALPELTNTVTFNGIEMIVGEELKAQTLATDSLMWQSVSIPAEHSASGREEPGVVFGSVVEVPTAGRFGLYSVYSLQPEADTLLFLQRMLFVGAGAILAMLGAITWLVTRQSVAPVRRAAATAARLADGQLSERMPARGYDEMATLARSFNEMAASLQDQIRRMEALSRAQRRFVSDVSHELRTPLTTIRMATEVIHASRDELDPAAMRSAELLQQQLDRFEELLADLLEISRFDAGAAVLDVEECDLETIINSVVESQTPLAEAKAIRVEVDVADAPVEADVDPRRVERILRNLVANAIDHAQGKPVTIAAASGAACVSITVRDRGIGLTMDEVDHVFDRFWRADPARARSTGGTGLGLAISQEDALLHKGRLEAWGLPGEGACFRLTLPKRAGLPIDDPPLPLVPEPDDAPFLPTRPANRRIVDRTTSLTGLNLLPAPEGEEIQ